MTRFLCLFLFGLTSITVAEAAIAKSSKQTLGWVEPVRIEDVGLVVPAKLDTGAKTSSIDAEIIDFVKVGKKTGSRPGEKVVFSILDEESKQKKTFEREVVRYVRIKQKGGGFIRRPVIEMGFCIGNAHVVEEVNLANRENFIYPVLVGRNMLDHAKVLVDASRTKLSRPSCQPAAPKE